MFNFFKQNQQTSQGKSIPGLPKNNLFQKNKDTGPMVFRQQRKAKVH